MVESGLILKWYKDHSPKESKCDRSLSSIGHNQAKLEMTKGPFLALLVGVAAATVVFVLEICTARLKTKLTTCNIRLEFMNK